PRQQPQISSRQEITGFPIFRKWTLPRMAGSPSPSAYHWLAFRGPPDLKIKRIETFANQFVGFVRITAEDGAQGIGQVSTYNSDITSQVLHRQVAPYVLGAEFDDIDALTDRVIEREHKFPGSYMKRALGGLDTAIWDLRGKVAGLPVVSLLGGTPGKLRTYASSMKRDITPADEAERFRRLRDQFGFDAFKFRIAAEYGHDVDEWEGRTEEI